MKKTELVQFKEEYESAVRNVDEIINNPYTAILLKYKKAEESNYCIKFRQYALRYWGQLHGVDFSEWQRRKASAFPRRQCWKTVLRGRRSG